MEYGGVILLWRSHNGDLHPQWWRKLSNGLAISNINRMTRRKLVLQGYIHLPQVTAGWTPAHQIEDTGDE